MTGAQRPTQHLPTRVPLDGENVDEALKPPEIARIPGQQRKILRQGCRSDHQIRCTTARKAARSQDCTGNQPVGARSLDPERNRLDEGLDQLESRLPTGALHRIRCVSRSGTQLGERHDADGKFLGKQGRVDLRQVNDDRRIEKANSVRLRHGAQDPDR